MYQGTYQGIDAKGKANFLSGNGQTYSYFVADAMLPELQAMAPGTPCQYEAGQPPGKKYYRLVTCQMTGAAPAPTTFVPVAQAAPPLPVPPQGTPIQPPVQPPQPSVDETAVQIFVTGVIGRCFHGTGTLPSGEELRDMVYACQWAFKNGLKGPRQPAPTPSNPVPGHPEDPGPWGAG